MTTIPIVELSAPPSEAVARHVARARAAQRAPHPWQANGMTLGEHVAGAWDRTRGTPE
jgi:hypothetical protein